MEKLKSCSFYFLLSYNIKRYFVFLFVTVVFITNGFCVATVSAFTGSVSLLSNGGDCNLVGSWDIDTKTCTLNDDISGQINISENDITLDGNNHILKGGGSERIGISVSYRSNITIKNLIIENFATSIEFQRVSNSTIQNVSVNNPRSHGLFMQGGSNNKFLDSTIDGGYMGIWTDSGGHTISGNTFKNIDTYGIKLYFQKASNILIENNIFEGNNYGIDAEFNKNNIIRGNTFRNNIGPGYYESDMGTNGTVIVHNNFIDNGLRWNSGQTSLRVYSTLSQDLPIGGNYWSDFDSVLEGCSDLDKNRICDSPKYINIYDLSMADFLPWTKENGWDNKIIPEEPKCLVDCFSNILFIPGLEASRLYKQKTILGIPVEDQLWEPNNNADVKDLYLNEDGTSINPDIYTRDIIRETNIPIPTGALGLNIYKSFSNMITDMVDKFEIADWKQYAYDWRQGVEDIVNNGTKYQDKTVLLVDTLQSLVDSSKTKKVTIIAHSNGGLIAKALLKKLQDDKIAGRNNLIDSIDVLILVAVPEIGTASAVPAILHGYDQRIAGGLLMSEDNARELGRNMEGAYGLLPSREYMNRVSASPVTFVDNIIPSSVTTKLVETFGNVLDSYSEYKDFLFGLEGRINPIPKETKLPIILSDNLFTKAEILHDSIDSFIPPENLRVVEVAGWGLDTIASFEYYPKYSCSIKLLGIGCKYVLDEKPRFTSDGDKTVVVPSAHYMGFLGNAEKYWVDLKVVNDLKTRFSIQDSHKDILEVDSLNNLIKSLIKNEDITFDTVLKNVEPVDDSNRLRLSIHSPVTMDAYDIDGNHTGKICSTDSDFCYIEENITNSSYMEFGEGKYINLPEDQLSKVKLQGTDIGTFTYESEKVLPDGTSTISSFVDIPVTTVSKAEITLNQDSIPELKLDVNGDGVDDFNLGPNADFDPITYLQIMKVTVDSLDLPQAKIKAFDNHIDKIIKAIEKGKIDKVKLTADKFKSFIEKKTAKVETESEFLLDMLNRLLVNLD